MRSNFRRKIIAFSYLPDIALIGRLEEDLVDLNASALSSWLTFLPLETSYSLAEERRPVNHFHFKITIQSDMKSTNTISFKPIAQFLRVQRSNLKLKLQVTYGLK